MFPINLEKDNRERIFYTIWDIIGEDKETNPYYIDGKTFYNVIKRFINGLPPNYSKYTQLLHEKGESTTRFDWCKELFCSLSQEEVPDLLTSLSESINEKLNKKVDINVLNENIHNLEDLNNITIEPIQVPLLNNLSMETNKKPKIFISHNSKDSKYAKSLVDLLIKLGLNDREDIFCSSLPGFGVKFGKSFIEEIKDQYAKHDLIMLFIHSPRYYESHVSLCEMGAAWILKNEYRSFLTSDCEFKILDAVIPPTEIAFKAGEENTYHLLNEFKTFIEEKFHLQPKDISRWETIKNDFIKEVTE